MANESQETTASNDMIELDAAYLAELEEEAKERYSENDEDFMKHCSKPAPKPPILPAERFQRNRNRGGFRGRRYGNDNRPDYKDNSSGYAGDRKRDYRGHMRNCEGVKKDYSNDRRDYSSDRRDYGSDRRDYGSDRRDYGGDRHDYGGQRRNYDDEERVHRHDQPRSFYYGHGGGGDNYN